MHLDTVFTMGDLRQVPRSIRRSKALCKLFEITLEKNGKAHFSSVTDALPNILKKVLNLPAVELIRCGGNDLMAAQREHGTTVPIRCASLRDRSHL